MLNRLTNWIFRNYSNICIHLLFFYTWFGYLRLFDECVFCCSLPFRINRLRKCQTQSNRRMWIKPIKNNPKKSVLKPFRNRTPKKCWPCWKNTFSRWAKWTKKMQFSKLAVDFVYFGLFFDFVCKYKTPHDSIVLNFYISVDMNVDKNKCCTYTYDLSRELV